MNFMEYVISGKFYFIIGIVYKVLLLGTSKKHYFTWSVGYIRK